MGYQDPNEQKDPEQQGSRGSANSLESILKMLEELDIPLGDDVTPENFLERLGVALNVVKSLKKKEEGDEDFETRPDGAQVRKPTPIVMSQDILEFSLQLQANQPKNPSTGQPWKPEEIRAAHKVHCEANKPPELELSANHKAAFDLLQRNNKQGIVDRISACVKNMTMPKDLGEDLVKQLNSTELKFSNDGKVDEDKHREIFNTLRMAESHRPGAAFTGSMDTARQAAGDLKLSLDTVGHPDGFEGSGSVHNLSDKQAEDNAGRLLQNLGL